ncbi:MAG: glycosyltransferase family 1 protein [archaeon]
MDRIKVDLLHLFQEGTGQTVYTKTLSKALKNSVDLQPINPSQFFLFNFLNRFSNSLAIKFLPFLLMQKIRKGSVVHIVNQELFFLLPVIKNSCVITLHDMSLYSYYSEWKEKDVLLLDKAKKIICDSDSTRKELTKNFPLFEKKCKSIHLGLSSSFSKSSSDARKKFGLKKNSRIVLFVGSDDPKKNFFSLLKAFSELKQENLVLVKAGLAWSMKKNQRKLFEEFISSKNLQQKVKFIDFPSTQDLIDLYFEAEVFVNPSHFEGFGLTLIEAMFCGCPVLCSDNTSFPEIAGNSALFFDSKNQEQIKEKLELVLNNKNLRQELIQKGFQNIKRFNSSKMAEETIEVYEQALKEK